MTTKSNWLNVLSLLILASLMLIACGGAATPTSEFITPGTGTPNELAATAEESRQTNVPPTSTNVPTATELPDPGMEELKKISEAIGDGGWGEFFGRTLPEAKHNLENTSHYTEGYQVMFVAKRNGAIEIWFGDTFVEYGCLDCQYLEYKFSKDADVDIEEAIREMQYVVTTNADELDAHAPDGITVTSTLMTAGSPAPLNLMNVNVDHDHDINPDTIYHFPARQYGQMNKDDVLTFYGGIIIAWTCTDSNTQSVGVFFTTFTSPCDMKNRYVAQNVFINGGTASDPAPRNGTTAENEELKRYLLSQLDEMTTGYQFEYYWGENFAYGDVQPLSGFDTTHLVLPTQTATPLATPTRTPRPTYTATNTPTATP